MNNNIKTYIIAGLILILGIFIGAILFSSEPQNEEHDHAQEQADGKVWTCSMHPQIRKDEAGDCPICAMDLIPASTMEDRVNPDAIVMSKTARKLAGVETMIIGNQSRATSLSFSGQLEINQDNTLSISANFKARIEKLYVNEEGEQVNKGQVIAELYAPEIQVLKEELALAKQQKNNLLLKSIKQKIQNYELSVSDIESLENGRLKLKSSKTGFITELNVKQGDNIKADQKLLSIADFSSLWAIVDIYESDLNKINVGDNLIIQTPNHQDISAEVTFISPVLDGNTRSAKARVVIQNPNQKLKPGVFITAELANQNSKSNSNQALMAPKSAILWTGKRSVVYQQFENENGVYFKMKEVETGKSSSDFVEILSALKAGDEIVTQGAFSVDSEAQLADRPSMMNPGGEALSTGHNHGGATKKSTKQKSMPTKKVSVSSEVKEAIQPLYKHYFDLKSALAADDLIKAKAAGVELKTAVSEVDLKAFNEESVDIWNQQATTLNEKLRHIHQMDDIKVARKDFIAISSAMIALTAAFRPLEKTVYLQHCPMAESNQGADWLSLEKEINNPYFGSKMLKCGSVEHTYN